MFESVKTILSFAMPCVMTVASLVFVTVVFYGVFRPVRVPRPQTISVLSIVDWLECRLRTSAS